LRQRQRCSEPANTRPRDQDAMRHQLQSRVARRCTRSM
jgi:hypothetical protein